MINDFYDNQNPFLYFQVGHIFPIQNLIESMIWKFTFDEFISNKQNQIFYGLLFMELNNYSGLIDTTTDNKIKNTILD